MTFRKAAIQLVLVFSFKFSLISFNSLVKTLSLGFLSRNGSKRMKIRGRSKREKALYSLDKESWLG